MCRILPKSNRRSQNRSTAKLEELFSSLSSATVSSSSSNLSASTTTGTIDWDPSTAASANASIATMSSVSSANTETLDLGCEERKRVRFGGVEVHEHKIIHDHGDGSLEEDMLFLLTVDWECCGSYMLPASAMGQCSTNGRLEPLNIVERREKIVNAQLSFRNERKRIRGHSRSHKRKPFSKDCHFYSKIVESAVKRLGLNDSAHQPFEFNSQSCMYHSVNSQLRK
jgi:hypothetical protein